MTKSDIDIPLIRRRTFFGNADRASVLLRPDGERLSWVAPLDGVLNVWVAPRDDLAGARPVTRDTGRGIRMVRWAFTNTHILYRQDKDGDENWRLYGVDLTNDGDKTTSRGLLAAVPSGTPGQ